MIDEKFLKGIGITDKDTVQKITETYAADIKAEQDAAAAVQTQLDEASKTIQSYKDMDIDGIKQSAADWETKYNTDTQALKDQLESTKYGYAVENAVGSLKFTSESAKKAFLADLTAKKLPIQEGKLLSWIILPKLTGF